MPRRGLIFLAFTLLACGTAPSAMTPPASSLPVPPAAHDHEDAAACPEPPPAAPSPSLQIAARLGPIDDVVAEALREGKAPGCVVVIGRHDEVLFRRAYGARSIEPSRTSMEIDTVFDLASLTKPLATATSVMSLVERGLVSLDEPVARYVPQFGRFGKGSITVRQLLTHTAGLPPDMYLSTYDRGRDAAMTAVYDLPLRRPSGTKFVYSDVGFQVLEEVVRRASGEDLASYTRRHIFEPLKMVDTGYLPGEAQRARAAPTEMRDGRWMQGEVHDPRAFKLGGVAGHAGVFSTADDLTRFAQMMLREGELDGARVLSPRSVSILTAPHDVPNGVRALGWDVRSSFSINRGEGMSLRAYGHGGYTGTALWIDPEKDLFVLFLSNRVHPYGGGAVNPLAGRIASIAASAVDPGVPATCDAAGDMKTGIDVLAADQFRALRGAHVGVITNVTGRARDGARTIDLLASAPGVDLVAIFAPEHGITSSAEGKIDGAHDEATSLPIYSLYGSILRPTPEMLKGIDTLVFDIQDVGARFYTYGSTMRRAMEAAADGHLRFVVLDRPNPINGLSVAGPILDSSAMNFVNYHPLPVRHGLTMGELALLLDADLHLGTALRVIRMEGWRRDDYYDETGLPFVSPSPNLRSVTEEILYPGVALLEGTNLSVGRGTDTPFEVIGAPWIDGAALASALAKEPLAGITFAPVQFTPDASNYHGERCGGVKLSVNDRDVFEPVRTGLAIARELFALYRDRWAFEAMGKMVASPHVFEALRAGKPLVDIEALWETELRDWKNKRDKYLLYPATPCAH